MPTLASGGHAQLSHLSGGWKCAIVGVPWWGSVSACLAWGDLFVNIVYKSAERLSLLRHHGTPMMVHLQQPEHTLLYPACHPLYITHCMTTACMYACLHVRMFVLV